jgi:sterol desaturase/sphingolipid hydroxylase (fatty acid hydroxylase superfamily)
MRWTSFVVLCLCVGIPLAVLSVTGGPPIDFESIVDKGTLSETVYQSVAEVWGAFIAGPGGSLFWGYLLLALVICYLLYVTERRGKRPVSSSLSSTGAGRPPPTSFRSFLFPSGFLDNPQVRRDLVLYIVITVIVMLCQLYLVFRVFTLTEEGVRDVLGQYFESPAFEPTIPVLVIFTIATTLTADLQFYAFHWLLHNTKLGWSIHMTHHSQTQLNVFTDDRENPLYPLIDTVVPAVFIALPMGVFIFLVPKAEELVVKGISIIFFLYRVTKIFRHSHVLVRFPRPVEWFLQSPAFHVVHHSSMPQHLSKNLGNVTTIWDRLFGTLYVPTLGEDYRFGTGDPELDKAHMSLRYIFIDQSKEIVRNFIRVLWSPFGLVAARVGLVGGKRAKG